MSGITDRSNDQCKGVADMRSRSMKEEAKIIFAVGQSVEPKKNKSFLIGQGVGDMMSEKLKPCPFCGRPVNITYNSLENGFSAEDFV